MNIFLLSELVDKGGAPIKGSRRVDYDITSKSTTDDILDTGRQGLSRYTAYGRRFIGEDDDVCENCEPKTSEPKKIKKSKINNTKKLKESSKVKMNSLIEDIFTKRDFDREFVRKGFNDSISTKIPDLDSVRETNPILIRKVAALKDIIEKNSASGEEKAVILNYLLSMDITDMSYEYKQELKSKLG